MTHQTRAARLLQLLDILHNRRMPIVGATLAQDLGVSLRTLYRDIATLRDQGADIEGGPGIGYVMKPGFTLPPLMFSADELEALLLGARWVSLQPDHELAAAAKSALARVESTLPIDMQLALGTSGLMVPGLSGATAPEVWLPALRRAIRAEHKIELDYCDVQGQTTRRIVWPFAIAFFNDSRLIAAWCELRQDFRHFRADRVITLANTRQPMPERRHVLIHRWREHMHLQSAKARAADKN